MRKPTKSQAFDKLIEMGVPIGTVIDVGVLTSTSTLMHAFPKCKHLLIEPIVEWNADIKRNYEAQGIDYELINVAASDRNGSIMMQVGTVRPGQPITHARMIEGASVAPSEGRREVATATIDAIVAERETARPFLLKIDVDGAEMTVLKGARKTLNDTSVVVIEAGMKNLPERAMALSEMGFLLFDVVDPCYYDDRLAQVDLVFLNCRTIEEHGLEMYKTAFDVRKWKEYA